MKVSLVDIEDAKGALSKVLEPTPLLFNRWLSERYGCNVYLKLENMQPVGSFKIRGASYKISKIEKSKRRKGVVASSAGNHAQGVAWAAAKFGIKATIVMPKNAPLTKVLNTQALGAHVVLHGDRYEDAYAHARMLEKKSGAVFVHPFEDRDVIAGQGTIALEVLDQLPETDFLIGAMGGGGLMAGIGTALKALKPKVHVIGAQAEGASSLVQSLKKHKVVQTGEAETFADGIKVKNVSAPMFRLLDDLIDEVCSIDDEKIAAAVLMLIEKARIISEGAAALTLGVLEELQAKNPKRFKGKNVVLVICGGNIDVNVLARIIDRGLIQTGRRIRLNVSIPDKPGSLNFLTKLVADEGANILQAIHDRDAPSVGLSDTGVEMTLETRGSEHSAKVIAALQRQYRALDVLK